jgi:ABC-type multidrug transport system fused ATPase/permease subunit
MGVSALAEVLSLGAVIPFLGVLVAPEKVFESPSIENIVRIVGIVEPSQLALPLTVVFIISAIVAGALRLSVLWASTRLAFAAGVDLSLEVYRRTLYQPYRIHIARNSSEVVSAITNKVGATLHVFFQCLTLISALFLMVAVVIALLAIDTVVASIAAIGFAICYGAITGLAKRRLESNSGIIAQESTALLKALQEGLGGIRDVLLDGSQPLYCDIYRRADVAVRRAQGDNMFVAGGPRFVMEILGMVLIAAIAFSASRQPGAIAAALPVLGALALGAQRLLPALQQSYAAWSGIAGSKASLMDILAMLDQPIPAEAMQPPPAALELRNEIRFEHVCYRYGEALPWVIEDIDLTIPRGARVGFVGSTGSGKSTAMDLLMGLIDPLQGQILVDGNPINQSSRRAWQRAIAHVPQAIFLADTSLTENIAFGISRESIVHDRVRTAARRAQLADFIEAQPDGYETVVGERGVRLSGGQRQRIGIARALYKQASVLVFDEATSALDNSTEQAVMQAIEQLGRDLTILIIAHRLSTVRGCDIIVQLEQGRITAQGTYDSLVECNPGFRALVAAAS